MDKIEKNWVFMQNHSYGKAPFTVGFYDLKGQWIPESDWNTLVEAAARVRHLSETPPPKAG